MNTSKQKFNSVLSRIEQACIDCDRQFKEVQLLGVSKTKPASQIREFYELGQQHFGENYLSEALSKQEDLNDLKITWHYIGQIQSNKTRLIANHFDWVHAVDRIKIAKRLNDQNEQNKKLNILIQINLDNEETKAGVSLDQAIDLIEKIIPLENLSLRGLMALPKQRDDQIAQQQCLAQLKTLLDHANSRFNLSLDTISAGMSGDLEAAISAGSTMVRVGTDLFGTRA